MDKKSERNNNELICIK